MIPHQRLDNGIVGSGLKDRVTACRNRLRVNRVGQKAEVEAQCEEVYSETTAASSLQGYAVMQYPVTQLECHAAAFAGSEPRDSETLLLVGEQEVGIT